MKLLIKDCIGIYNTIEFFKESGIGFELGWKLDDIQQAIKIHVERAQKENNSIAEKYGTQNEKGYKIEPEKIPAFNSEIEKVLNVEVEVELKPVSFDDLKDLKLNGTTDINAFKKVVVRGEN